MITEQELRFGNFLNYNNIAYKVVKIENGFIGLDREDDFEDYADVKDIDPIPLTEEILFKAGFIFDKDNEDYNLNGITLEDRNTDKWSKHINKDEFGIWYLNSYLRDIKYLHQLQNLLYSITNKELGITL